MDEKFLENLENIAGNVEYLIEFLEEREKNKDTGNGINTIDAVQTSFDKNNSLLSDIKKATIKNTEVLTGYMQRLDDVDEILNTDLEMENFNLMLNEMISKIDELKLSLDNLGVNYELTLNDEALEEIREKLQDGLTIDISPDSLDEISTFKATIEDLQNNISEFQNINNIADFSQWTNDIADVRDALESLREVNLDNIDLSVLDSENIDKILENLSNLKDSVTNIDIQTNLEEIEQSLDKIKNIDITSNLESIKEELSNIDDLKIDIDVDEKSISDKIGDLNIGVDIDEQNISNQIDDILSSLKTESIVEIDFKMKENITERLNELQTEITNFINDIPPLLIDTEISVKTDRDLIIENLESELNNADITISPNIDLTSEIERLNNEGVDFNIKPNIEVDESNIRVKDDSPNIKQTVVSDDKTDELLMMMQKNNELLAGLADSINKSMKNDVEAETVTGGAKVSVIDETTSIAKVNPTMQQTESEELRVLKSILGVMQSMSVTNQKLLIEQLKSKFSGDINI
jgi:hypothetical protein